MHIKLEHLMPRTRLLAPAAFKAYDPSVVVYDDGSRLLVWQDTLYERLHIQSFDLSGNSITEIAVIDTKQGAAANSDHFTADLDQLASGELIMTWEYTTSAISELYTQTIDAPPIVGGVMAKSVSALKLNVDEIQFSVSRIGRQINTDHDALGTAFVDTPETKQDRRNLTHLNI